MGGQKGKAPPVAKSGGSIAKKKPEAKGGVDAAAKPRKAKAPKGGSGGNTDADDAALIAALIGCAGSGGKEALRQLPQADVAARCSPAGLQGAATCADSSPGSHRQKRCASPLLSDQAAKSLKTDAWAYRCGPGAAGAPTSEHRPVAFIPVSSEAVTPAKFQLLKQLLREGDITQSEYEDKRKELLARI